MSVCVFGQFQSVCIYEYNHTILEGNCPPSGVTIDSPLLLLFVF